MMAQNRKPPAYQEYAAELLANKHFRLMSLAERGLLYTLRLECWANMTTPSNKEELAKYLGLSVNDLVDAFTTKLKSFIEINGDDLRIPEIDDYRNHLHERREKQSKGGKVGALITNKKLARGAGNKSAYSLTKPTSTSHLPRQGIDESLVEFNKAKVRKAQSVKPIHDKSLNNHGSWVDDYDKASNGG